MDPGRAAQQARPDRSSRPRRAAIRSGALLLVLLASTLLALGLSHPGRVAIKTLLLLPDMFPTSPVRPLTWFTPEPRREEYDYNFSVGRVESDIYSV